MFWRVLLCHAGEILLCRFGGSASFVYVTRCAKKIQNMNRNFYTYLGVLVLSLFCGVANAMEWRTINYLDFGGNDADAPNSIAWDMNADGRYGTTELEYVGKSYDDYNRIPQNRYFILKSLNGRKADWSSGGDHTYEDDPTRGYYMFFDPTDEDIKVWYRYDLVGLCTGVKFKFSFYMANIHSSLDGQECKLALVVADGNQTSNELERKEVDLTRYNSTPDKINWMEQVLEFKNEVESGFNGDRLAFMILPTKNFDPNSPGNDFCIDDIKVEIEQPSVTFSEPKFVYMKPVTLSADVPTSELSSFFADLSTVKYWWSYSETEDGPFTELYEGTYSSDNKFSYTIDKFNKDDRTGKGNGVYRLTIANPENKDNEVCSVIKDFKIDEVNNTLELVLCEGMFEDEKSVVDTLGHKFTYEEALDGGTTYTSDGVKFFADITFRKVKVDSTTNREEICKGEPFSGKKYDEIGRFEYREPDVTPYKDGECDSLIVLYYLDVKEPTVEKSGDVVGCIGKEINGRFFDKAGTYPDTLFEGCTHKARNIIVLDEIRTSVDFRVCQGEKGPDGKVYNEAGTFKGEPIVEVSQIGCDSFVDPNIIVTGKVEVDLGVVEVCDSEGYEFDGKVYSEPGEYDVVANGVSAVTGCDSVTTAHIIVNKSYLSEVDTLICRDQILFGKEYTKAGYDTVRFDYKTEAGCDSVEIYNITILDVQLRLRAQFDVNAICFGQQTNLIVDLIPSNVPLTWEPELRDNNPLRPVIKPSETTTYVAHARNSVGCHATDSITIDVNDRPTLTIESVSDETRSVSYVVEGGTPTYTIYVEEKEMGNLASATLSGMTFGEHEIRVVDTNACDASATFVINKLEVTPSGSITPNGDGLNDTWQIKNIDVYPLSVVRIYDRTGRLIFEKQGYSNETGWDGSYNGAPMPSADYWYEIDVEEIDQQYYGHFTLLR